MSVFRGLLCGIGTSTLSRPVVETSVEDSSLLAHLVSIFEPSPPSSTSSSSGSLPPITTINPLQGQYIIISVYVDDIISTGDDASALACAYHVWSKRPTKDEVVIESKECLAMELAWKKEPGQPLWQ
ncbi:hypothetical protein EZV62_003676 [Acer yangbiense]|uniref:Uncharacterized protein n=1 Tax=Acer yangbiense TaxID=1000413 RepID=A0A5C7IHY5_9ROSI|nr:hypothetical protein EZV62_003676 [Acer yangbiense]